MKLRFTARATQDLVEMAEYLRAENPAAAERVRASILQSLSIIAEFPGIGRRQAVESVRKHVTRKYGYLVDADKGEIAILGIRHPPRERPFSDR